MRDQAREPRERLGRVVWRQQRAAPREAGTLLQMEIGREMVYGEASDALLAEAEAELVKEAMS